MFFIALAQGQNQYNLHIIWQDSVPKAIKHKTVFKDSVAVHKTLQRLVFALREKGHAAASIDSVVWQNKQASAYAYLGKQFVVNAVVIDSALAPLLTKKINLKSTYNPAQLQQIKQQALYQLVNNGYAFAQVYYQVDGFGSNTAQFVLKATLNNRVYFDSINVVGNVKFKPKYLERLLLIKPKALYSQNVVNQIDNRLSNLSFANGVKPAQIEFYNDKATVNLFVEKQKANQFDLLLGFQPNNQLANGKFTFTGKGTLLLNNAFGVGEKLFVDFQQVKPQTQYLDIAVNYPYFINLPFGVFANFNLYKEDTAFVQLNGGGGLNYKISAFSEVSFFYKGASSNVLNYDTITVKQTGVLPEILDVRSNQYGANVAFNRLNYQFNPRQGTIAKLGFSVGTRKVKPNSVLLNLTQADGTSLQNIYESIGLNNVVYELNYYLEHYLPIKKKSTFKMGVVGAYKILNNIKVNEYYRVGGYKSLRGFDEQSVISPYYNIATLEYRYLISKNSFFNVFADFAAVEDIRYGAKHIDFPIGFGTGVSLETKGGIFALSYALGRQLNNPINIRNGKIHFGYINIF